MSYDEMDAWQDAAMDSLYSDFREDPETRASFYEELYDEIVQDFTADRLRSYFVEHPELVVPAAQALADARALVAGHQTAGFTRTGTKSSPRSCSICLPHLEESILARTTALWAEPNYGMKW
jgi:hypothetical protein